MIAGQPLPAEWQDTWNEDSTRASAWRSEAEHARNMVVGHQWQDTDIMALKAARKPALTFNRIAPVVDSICGHEIGNRLTIRYVPREEGDAEANEVLTGAGEWFVDTARANEENSEAFRDVVVTGMGWTETRLDYDRQPDGKPYCERVDPFEMLWDSSATRPNLEDARHAWRVRRVPLREAERMFPGYSAAMLDASWARPHQPAARNEGYSARSTGTYDLDSGNRQSHVTLVQVQWRDRERYAVILDESTGQTREVSPEEAALLEASMADTGFPLSVEMLERNVIRQAFIGQVVLAVMLAPCQTHFSWQAITGRWDAKRRYWYGVVRAMIDPQEWANKWLSQALHVMNVASKGGVIIESDATVGGLSDFEESWAASDAVTVVAPGALQGGKLQPKPVTPIPPHLLQLTEHAIASIRDVAGVSLEMLGMREVNQPGVLEYQRRQAGITILQWLFDAFRRYRKTQGELILYYVQHYMSDGRLIRIVGENRARYVPLVADATSEYDVIVDEAPTSPNQRERTWQLVMSLMPMVKDMLTPAVMLELLKVSPLPTSFVERIAALASAPNPAAETEQVMRARQMAADVAGKEADVEKTRAEAARIAAGLTLQTERMRSDSADRSPIA